MDKATGFHKSDSLQPSFPLVVRAFGHPTRLIDNNVHLDVSRGKPDHSLSGWNPRISDTVTIPKGMVTAPVAPENLMTQRQTLVEPYETWRGFCSTQWS